MGRILFLIINLIFISILISSCGVGYVEHWKQQPAPVTGGENNSNPQTPADVLTITSPAEGAKVITFVVTFEGTCDSDALPFTVTPNTGETNVTIINSSCTNDQLEITAGFKAAAWGVAENRSIKVVNGTEALVRTVSLRKGCPSGFIGVPGNGDQYINTTDFCVAKYEMKAETDPGAVDFDDGNNGYSQLDFNNYRAESRASGTPWVNINRTQAETECTAREWYMLTNAQWQTIARNIEANTSNWVTGGKLARGHSDNEKAVACNIGATNAIEASSDDGDGYYCTNDTSSEVWDSGLEQRRTQTLSNGEVIWDLAGNVWEWVSDDVSVTPGANILTPNPDLSNAQAQEFSNDTFFPFVGLEGMYNRNLFGPLGNYTSADGIGYFYGGWGSYGGAVLRGGSWLHHSLSGVFGALLSYDPSFWYYNFGFRCASAPSSLP